MYTNRFNNEDDILKKSLNKIIETRKANVIKK